MTQRVAKERIAIVGTLSNSLLGFRGELIKDMKAEGHEVFAFCTDYSERSRGKVRSLGAVPVDYGMGQLSLNPFNELMSFIQLYKLFKHHDITLSLCYFAKPVIYGTTAAWLAGVPKRVAKIEGLGRVFVGRGLKYKFLRFAMVVMYKFSLSKADLLLLLNPDDKKDLIDHFNIKPKRTEVIGGIGVCLEQYKATPVPVDKVRFIFVGRLLAEKGIRYYLNSAQALRSEYGDRVEFIVLGAPDSKQQSKGGVSKQELDQYVERGIVTYPGKVSDVKPWLAKSSVFVLPSYYREGVPRSTQEALAMGRAVITTDMPGCRETVEHGISGFMVPPKEQQALTEAMREFVERPSIAVDMGKVGRELAERKFDVRLINAYIQKMLNEI